MRTRSKLLLAGLTAALAFGAFVSAAPARRFAISGRQWRATWNKLAFIGPLATVECHVTLEGSFHSRTIAKVLEALIGYISRITVDETHCTGGSARALTEILPWHIRYNGFSGTLPSITKIHIKVIRGGFIIQRPGVKCQFAAEVNRPFRAWIIRLATGVAENIQVDETAEIARSSGEAFLCGENGRLGETTNSLTEGPGGPTITVTLVA